MSEQSSGKRRVSLRGRGREILTGQPREDAPAGEIDAEALHLTPQEAESLLALDVPTGVPVLPDDAALDGAVVPSEPDVPEVDEQPSEDGDTAEMAAEQDVPDFQPDTVEALSDAGIALADEGAAAELPSELGAGDALPEPFNPWSEVHAGISIESVVFDAPLAGAAPAADHPAEPEDVNAPEPFDAPDEFYDAGEPLPEDLAALLGALEDEETLDERPFPEPFPAPDAEADRPDSLPEFLADFDRVEWDSSAWDEAEQDQLQNDPLPSPEIGGPPPGEHLPAVHGYAELAAVVDDAMLRRLVEQIESLQEDLAGALEFEPEAVEAWQRQLFEAHLYLMQSRANYEAARMAVIGIQTEVNRQRRVRADVMRYRPLLLNYLVGWGIAWVVLMALKGMVVGVADTIGLMLVAAAYYPALFGVLGALVSSYLTLEDHAVRQRDFDPLYITGYLVNPLLGAAAGLLAFLVFGLANHRVLDGTTTDLERIVLWIAAAIVGLNQSAILRRVAALFSRDDTRSDQST